MGIEQTIFDAIRAAEKRENLGSVEKPTSNNVLKAIQSAPTTEIAPKKPRKLPSKRGLAELSLKKQKIKAQNAFAARIAKGESSKTVELLKAINKSSGFVEA